MTGMFQQVLYKMNTETPLNPHTHCYSTIEGRRQSVFICTPQPSQKSTNKGLLLKTLSRATIGYPSRSLFSPVTLPFTTQRQGKKGGGIQREQEELKKREIQHGSAAGEKTDAVNNQRKTERCVQREEQTKTGRAGEEREGTVREECKVRREKRQKERKKARQTKM